LESLAVADLGYSDIAVRHPDRWLGGDTDRGAALEGGHSINGPPEAPIPLGPVEPARDPGLQTIDPLSRVTSEQ
jgi:hypothetical protein